MVEKPTAFTAADLAQWQVDLRDNRPEPPKAAGWGDGLMISSFIAASTPTGLVVRARLSSGRDVDILLNPVVAEAMLATIVKAGTVEGWLSEDLMAVIPR